MIFVVNGYTYGLFQDVLEELESKLNFSTLLYKNKKDEWGFVYPQSDGTFRGTGIGEHP